MHYNTGYHPEAASLMRHFLDVFRDAEIICIPSASCVAMIRDNYPKIESGDAMLMQAVRELLPRIFEFTELLTEKLGITARGRSGTRDAALHPLCVVFADQVVETVPEGIRRLAGRSTMTTISGPSATSDIEMARIKGVHGPRSFDVILVVNP